MPDTLQEYLRDVELPKFLADVTTSSEAGKPLSPALSEAIHEMLEIIPPAK